MVKYDQFSIPTITILLFNNHWVPSIYSYCISYCPLQNFV